MELSLRISDNLRERIGALGRYALNADCSIAIRRQRIGKFPAESGLVSDDNPIPTFSGIRRRFGRCGQLLPLLLIEGVLEGIGGSITSDCQTLVSGDFDQKISLLIKDADIADEDPIVSLHQHGMTPSRADWRTMTPDAIDVHRQEQRDF